MIANRTVQAHIFLLIAAFFHAGNFTAAKIVMPEHLEPFGLIVLRIIIAGSLFWLLHYFRIREKIEDKKDYLRLLRVAFFGTGINIILFFHGLSYSAPINASLIMTTTPVLVLLISAVILKERITLKKITGIILGATGAVLLIAGEGFSWKAGNALFGNLLIFINALSYGTFLVLVKPLMRKYQAFTVYKWTFLFGTLFTTGFGIKPIMNASWSTFGPEVWGAIAFVSIGGTFLTFLLNAWALQRINPSVVGMYIYLQPVLATIIALALNKDELTAEKVLLSLLIFAGVYLVSSR